MRYCYGCNTVYETKSCPHCATPLAAVSGSTNNQPRSWPLIWGTREVEPTPVLVVDPVIKREPNRPRRTTMPGIPKVDPNKVPAAVVVGDAVFPVPVAGTPVAQALPAVVPVVESAAPESSEPILTAEAPATAPSVEPPEAETSPAVTDAPVPLDTASAADDEADVSVAEAGREHTIVELSDSAANTLPDVSDLPPVAEDALAEAVEFQAPAAAAPDDLTQVDVFGSSESNNELLPPWEEAPLSAQSEGGDTPTALFDFEKAADEAAPSVEHVSTVATQDPSEDEVGYLGISRAAISDQLSFHARMRAQRDAIEAEDKKPMSPNGIVPEMLGVSRADTPQPDVAEPPRWRRTGTPAPVVEAASPDSQESPESERSVAPDEAAQSADTTLLDVRGLRNDVAQDPVDPKSGQVRKKRGLLSFFRGDATDEDEPSSAVEPDQPKKKGKSKKT